jgi:hypothetical protein
MKLPSPRPDEQRYAVAIRDGSDLWLTLWVRCWPKGDIYVMYPRGDREWDVHASYHRNGKMHIKSKVYDEMGHPGPIEKKMICQTSQGLTAGFKGFEQFVNLLGHGKRRGEVCDPRAFGGVVCVEPDILDGPGHGSVAVDLLEPGYAPKPDPSAHKQRTFPRGARPSVVITIWATQDNVSLNWPDDFIKIE